MIKKNKGITLISLVITVIILLILAGISISSLSGSGMFEKTKLAKEESRKADIIEYINLKLDEILIDNYDKDINEFMEVANSEFKKDETKKNLQQYGKEVTISDVVGQEDKLQFYITINNKIYEVQKTGAIYKGESTEVGKPSIEIISGTNGENGYYRSNVELKITQIDTENLYKIKYKLEGAMVKEDEIENGGIINITEEGKTKIIVTSYDYTNNKSEDVELEIKKDCIAPEIELSDANPSAREYSKKVTAKIKDNVSNIQSRKYAYKNQTISFFKTNGIEFLDSFTVRTQDNITANHNGPQKIYTVYAKDEAGNESVKTIELPNLLIDNIVTGSNGLSVTSGNIDQGTGKISINSGAVQYGPYWSLSVGTYEITYLGTGLPAGNYDCCESDDCKPFEMTPVDVSSSNKKVYTVVLPHASPDIQCRLINPTSSMVYLDSIRIRQL